MPECRQRCGHLEIRVRLPLQDFVSCRTARDAARYLERGPAVLQSPPDAAPAAAAAIQDLPDLRVEPADVPAGVTGRSADGRVVVDNTLAAILARRRADLSIGLGARI